MISVQPYSKRWVSVRQPREVFGQALAGDFYDQRRGGLDRGVYQSIDMYVDSSELEAPTRCGYN